MQHAAKKLIRSWTPLRDCVVFVFQAAVFMRMCQTGRMTSTVNLGFISETFLKTLLLPGVTALFLFLFF